MHWLFFFVPQAEEVSAVVDPPPSTVTEVTVVLEDVNDQTPTFRAAHYVAEVAEGAQFNMPVNLIGDAIPEVYDNDQVGEDSDSRWNVVPIFFNKWVIVFMILKAWEIRS